MKNGIIGIVGLALFAVAGVARAQIVHISTTGNTRVEVDVPEGKIMHVMYMQAAIGEDGNLQVDGKTMTWLGTNANIQKTTVKDIYYKGSTVSFFRVYVTYQFVDPPNTEGLKKPSTAVVIPADEGGDVEIIMESSTDMVTWTEALPGTYGTDTAKRFFRLRAVRVAAAE